MHVEGEEGEKDRGGRRGKEKHNIGEGDGWRRGERKGKRKNRFKRNRKRERIPNKYHYKTPYTYVQHT